MIRAIRARSLGLSLGVGFVQIRADRDLKDSLKVEKLVFRDFECHMCHVRHCQRTIVKEL